MSDTQLVAVALTSLFALRFTSMRLGHHHHLGKDASDPEEPMTEIACAETPEHVMAAYLRAGLTLALWLVTAGICGVLLARAFA